MTNFFADNFADCVVLAVFLLAMFPMVESKVAIPFALSSLLWNDATLSPACAFFVALAGSVLPTILVILLCKWIKSKTSGFVHDRFTTFVERKYRKKLDKVDAKTSTFKKCLALCAFVAIPLPLTGVYTGGLIAGFSNLTFWQGFLSIFAGEVISCIAILLLCLLFENSAFYILIASLILIAIFVFVGILEKIISKFIKSKREKQNQSK